jgi:hypothetical protein
VTDHSDKVREHADSPRPPSSLHLTYESVRQIGSEDGPPEQAAGMYGTLGPPSTGGEPATENPSEKQPPKLPDLDPAQVEWANSRIDLLNQDRRFCLALRAIMEKRANWCKDIDLSGVLCFFVVGAVGERGVSRQTREDFWSLQTGKTWKALKDFPARLRNMADEVKQVSRGIAFDPQKWIPDDTATRRFAKRQFVLLPGGLRVFASYIEKQIDRLPVMSASHLPPKKHGYSQFVVHVSLLIKFLTGRYRDAEAAELLESAALALGTNKRFDIQTLQKLRSRHKRRNIKS